MDFLVHNIVVLEVQSSERHQCMCNNVSEAAWLIE